MPPPPVTGTINILNNPLLTGLNDPLGPILPQPLDVPQADIGNGNAPNEPNAVPPPPDPALAEAIVNGEGPNLQPGNNQGEQFAANHTVTARNWDLNSANGMLDTARRSVEYVRAVVTGTELDDCVEVSGIESGCLVVSEADGVIRSGVQVRIRSIN